MELNLGNFLGPISYKGEGKNRRLVCILCKTSRDRISRRGRVVTETNVEKSVLNV